MIKILLTMLCSSNILFLCFLVATHMRKNYPDIRWKSIFLKTCLFFALVPVALFKGAAELTVLHQVHKNVEMPFVVSGKEDVIILTAGEVRLTDSMEMEVYLIALWLLSGVLIFLCRISNYLMKRRKIVKYMQKVEEPDVLAIRDRYMNKLNLRRPVTLYANDTQSSPFTTGVWNTIVVIPSGLEELQLDVIIAHELCHVKNGDTIYGFLRIFVLSLYWFDPLFYMMDYEIEKVSELICDAKATRDTSEEQKMTYIRLMISMIPTEGSSNFCAFSRYKKDIEERVVNIMNMKKISKREKVLSVVLSVFMILVGSTPVWAYQNPRILKTDRYGHQTVDISTELTVGFQDAGVPGLYPIGEILLDAQFTSSDGVVYDARDIAETSKACGHTYKDGTYSVHKKNSDGSCTVRMYEAKRCTKCGYIMQEDLLWETNYVTCTH